MELPVITYEQAKAINNIGFSSDEYRYIYVDKELYTLEEYDEMDCGGPFSMELSESETLEAYSLELIAKWLRDEKNIFVDVRYDIGNNSWVYYIIDINNKNTLSENHGSNTYEEALKSGINECLKILGLVK